ncbi:MAG: hypothetical protein NTW12_12975 [Deltaproteobacteria bacterium]|nr:hypothetical protein [Deltaproteobacteria bacterium]
MSHKNEPAHDLNSQKDQFVKYLDSEIIYLDKTLMRPGWTKWAIIGSIATVIWIIINRLDAGKYLIGNIVIITVSISLCIDIYQIIKIFVPKINLPLHEKRFSFSTYVLGSNRAYLTLHLMRASLVIIIIYLMSNIPSQITKYSIYISNIMQGTAILSLILCSFFMLPMPLYESKNMRSKSINFILLVMLLCSIVGLWGLIELLRVSRDSISIEDIQIPFLVYAIYYLFMLLTYCSQEYPLINKLVNIKRFLVFNKISLEDARKQAEIAITGLKISEIFQDIINEIISDFQLFNECVDKLSMKFETSNDLLSEPETDVKIRNLDIVKTSATDYEAKTLMKNADRLIDDISIKVKKFHFTTDFVVGVDKNMSNDINNVLNQITEIMEVSGLRFKQLKQKIEDFYKVLEETEQGSSHTREQ